MRRNFTSRERPKTTTYLQREYSSTFPKTKKSQACDATSLTVDSSRLQCSNALAPIEHSTRPSDDFTPSLSECRALVVNEVNAYDLLHGELERSPPVQLVKFPVEDISKVAVLSWRWDGDLKSQGSRNIASAVLQAQRTGVLYLFIDVISIDQDLDGDALIEQVMAFSTLYQHIPVIAAYDTLDEERNTLLRPWILHELRQMSYNNTKVVYLNHNNGGHNDEDDSDPDLLNEKELLSLKFSLTLQTAQYNGAFLATILGVAAGDIGMTCVSDFKYIMPMYAKVLNTAYQKMSRSDYLLTTALLVRLYSPPFHSVRFTYRLQALTYDRYVLSQTSAQDNCGHYKYHISLNGIEVGAWWAKGVTSMVTCKFDARPDAGRIIFKTLELSDADYQDFFKQMRKQKLSRHRNAQPLAAGPFAEVVYIKL